MNEKELISIIYKGPLFLPCQIFSVECPTTFEFGATFSIMVYALNWLWFVFDLCSLICTPIDGAGSPYRKQCHL